MFLEATDGLLYFVCTTLTVYVYILLIILYCKYTCGYYYYYGSIADFSFL